MKKILSVLLALAMIVPMFSFTLDASSGGVRENPEALLPYGDIDITGEINPDEYAEIDFSDDTVGYFWAQNPFTVNAKLYFRASDKGLYFAADIYEGTSKGNNYVPSTGVDNINNDGEKHNYGYNGDIMTLMLDPLGMFEKSSVQNTAWYNIALFADGSGHMYRSRVNEADITDKVEVYGKIKTEEEGWYFQSFIPWDIIIADAKTAYGDCDLSVDTLTSGLVTRAACMYMDRYSSYGRTNTWGRFITVCEKMHNGHPGTASSGPVAEAFGLKLNIDKTNNHTYSAWETVSKAKCEEDGLMKRVCSECKKEETKIIPALGHDWSAWVVESEPTPDENGSKVRNCSRCEAVDRRILAYTENDPQVVVYYNATQSTTSYEFENIDVINFHPVQLVEAAGYPGNPLRLNSMAQLAFVRNTARKQNPDIKFTVAIANENLSVFESWLKGEEYREHLAEQIVATVEKYELDGVDIDYEFPTSTDLQDDFVAFAVELRKQLDGLSYEVGRELTLSMAVPAGNWAFSLFDMTELAKSVDWFNIMSYDLYCGSNFKLTHHHTPAYDNSVYEGGSVASDIALYISKGISKDKIVVGAGMYARRWTGVDSDTDGLFAPGVCDSSNIHYSDLRSSYINKNGYVRYWDENSQAPYLYNKEEKVFISYDDEESVSKKCDLVLSNGIRGIMVFDYCTCDGCGFFEQLADFLDASTGNHIWSTWTTTKTPDCVNEGQKMRTCSCGEVEYQAIPALGHSYETEWITIPTATENGSYRYFCTRCGIEEAPIETALTPDSYWDIASDGQSFAIKDGDICVQTNGNTKINPYAKIISKYQSQLDGFNAVVTPTEDTDSISLFWTNAHDWYDGASEWSVGVLGPGAGNYRYGNINSSQAANEYTYTIVLCDKLDLGWYQYSGTDNDGIFDTVVNHTVSHGNFWGSKANEISYTIGEALEIEMFNRWDEDDESWSLGYIINGDRYYDTNCVEAFDGEGENDGYYFGVIAYTEGSTNANAAFTLDRVGEDETTADFTGWPEAEHEHEFGEWYAVIKPSCSKTGIDKRKCTCGICEKRTTEKTEHTFGEWSVVTEATKTETGLKERICSVCGEKQTEVISATDTTPVTCSERHLLKISNADSIAYIRLAKGEYETASEIKKADGLVTINKRIIEASSESGVFMRRMTESGIYTLWLRCDDGTEYIRKVEILDPENPIAAVSAEGITVKVGGIAQAKAVRIAEGCYTGIREMKQSGEGYLGIPQRCFTDGEFEIVLKNLKNTEYTVCVEFYDGYSEYYTVSSAK